MTTTYRTISIYVCDQCGKKKEFDSGEEIDPWEDGFFPYWELNHKSEGWDFCSIACLIQWSKVHED